MDPADEKDVEKTVDDPENAEITTTAEETAEAKSEGSENEAKTEGEEEANGGDGSEGEAEGLAAVVAEQEEQEQEQEDPVEAENEIQLEGDVEEDDGADYNPDGRSGEEENKDEVEIEGEAEAEEEDGNDGHEGHKKHKKKHKKKQKGVGFGIKKNIALIICNPQNDFLPDGKLPIPTAINDGNRISEMIMEHIGEISDIYVSLDSRHRSHISNPLSWVDGETSSKHPEAYTVISRQDVENGKWKSRVGILQETFETYVHDLEDTDRNPLLIWPEHCLVGTFGHAVMPTVNEALQEWAEKNLCTIEYIIKATSCLTEMYSCLSAEVPTDADPSTCLDLGMIDRLQSADKVIVCGQSLSHTVNMTVNDLVNNWDVPNSNICLLLDCCSPVPGFEEMSETFVQDMREKGLTCCNAQEAFIFAEKVENNDDDDDDHHSSHKSKKKSHKRQSSKKDWHADDEHDEEVDNGGGDEDHVEIANELEGGAEVDGEGEGGGDAEAEAEAEAELVGKEGESESGEQNADASDADDAAPASVAGDEKQASEAGSEGEASAAPAPQAETDTAESQEQEQLQADQEEEAQAAPAE